jgi:hypothetical protein
MLGFGWNRKRDGKMPYGTIAGMLAQEPEVELSTRMKTPCLRYQGDFVTMMFEQED